MLRTLWISIQLGYMLSNALSLIDIRSTISSEFKSTPMPLVFQWSSQNELFLYSPAQCRTDKND